MPFENHLGSGKLVKSGRRFQLKNKAPSSTPSPMYSCLWLSHASNHNAEGIETGGSLALPVQPSLLDNPQVGASDPYTCTHTCTPHVCTHMQAHLHTHIYPHTCTHMPAYLYTHMHHCLWISSLCFKDRPPDQIGQYVGSCPHHWDRPPDSNNLSRIKKWL